MELNFTDLPLVSVVLPIYNPQGIFQDTIKSILNQKYNKIEVIISDDGNYDAAQLPFDSRIRYVKNSTGKRGIFPNLNNAILNSQGELIQIFCQDDVMSDRFISEQVRYLTAFPLAGMVFSSFHDLIGKDTQVNFNQIEEKVVDIRCYTGEFFLNKLFVKGCMPGNLSPVMLRRSVLDVVGQFSEDFRYCGDFDYWIRVAGHCSVVYHSTRYLHIRNHDDQASNTLPIYFKIVEEKRCYERLLELNTINCSKTKLNWYLNERVGVQHFVNYLRKTNGKQKGVKLKDLFSFPFSISKIIILTICSFKNHIRLFYIDEADC